MDGYLFRSKSCDTKTSDTWSYPQIGIGLSKILIDPTRIKKSQIDRISTYLIVLLRSLSISFATNIVQTMRNIQELQEYFLQGGKDHELFSVPSEIIISTPQPIEETIIEKREHDIKNCKHASPCSETINTLTMRNMQELREYFYKGSKKYQTPSENIINTPITIEETILREKAPPYSERINTSTMRNIQELQEYFYKGRNEFELFPVPSEITIDTPQTIEETIVKKHEDDEVKCKQASPCSDTIYTPTMRNIRELQEYFYNNKTENISDNSRSNSSDSQKRTVDKDLVIHSPKHQEYHDSCNYSNGQQHFISVDKTPLMPSCCAVTEAETETICSSHNDEVNDRSCFSAVSAISFDEYIFDAYVELEENEYF